jgi:nucleotide-binding universal stress UspA family protein
MTFKPKKIRVPIALGSEEEREMGLYAIRAAGDLAQAFGGSLELITVIKPGDVHDPVDPAVVSGESNRVAVEGAQIHGAEVRKAQMALEEAGSAAAGAANMSFTVKVYESTDIPHQINQAVDALSCDAVVMPSHGRKGVARVILGSVAEKVVQGAQVPVLVLHDGKAP